MASMLDAQRSGGGGLSKLGEGPRVNSDGRTQAGLGRGPNQSKKLINAAWTDVFPAQGATLDLDFANDRGFVRGVGQGRSMDAVTFTRASLGRYVDQSGLLAEAANGEPRFDWASTASTGAGTIASPFVIPLAANPTSNGLLIEEARTNRILWCRDATQAAWVSTNVTAAKDQTGIDGVANAASSLTATANDGTCIQTITLASGSRTGSAYLKRLTGTGNVQVSLDGSTWSTVDLSDTEWRRIVLSETVTNPTVGIKLATNGDAVAMDYGQVEDGAFVTSPILTTGASATRAAEATSINLTNSISILNYQSGTALVNFFPYVTPIASGENTIINVGGVNGYFNFYNSTGSRFGLRAAGNVINTGADQIYPLIDNIIAASWATTGIKRSTSSGFFDERFVNFAPFPPQAFTRVAAINSTTKRLIYWPMETTINELNELINVY